MLVTGVDQTSHSRFLLRISSFCSSFHCLCFCTLSIICCMTLIYSFTFSVPNIVDPKSLALPDVSPSRFLMVPVMETGTSLCVHAGGLSGQTLAASGPAAWMGPGFFSPTVALLMSAAPTEPDDNHKKQNEAPTLTLSIYEVGKCGNSHTQGLRRPAASRVVWFRLDCRLQTRTSSIIPSGKYHAQLILEMKSFVFVTVLVFILLEARAFEAFPRAPREQRAQPRARAELSDSQTARNLPDFFPFQSRTVCFLSGLRARASKANPSLKLHNCGHFLLVDCCFIFSNVNSCFSTFKTCIWTEGQCAGPVNALCWDV